MEESGRKLGEMVRSGRFTGAFSGPFTGEFEHSLDLKGRLIIPSKYRMALDGKCYLVNGWDRECIYLFPETEWSRLIERYLTDTNLVDENTQDFTRFLAAGASDCEIDKQGRIFIPQNLREYAGIEARVTVVGVINRIEIWDADSWQDLKKAKPFKALVRQMKPLIKS